MRAGLALLAALVATGCGSSDPCDPVKGICITATVEGNAKNLDQLQFTVDSPTNKTLSTPTPPSKFGLPVRVALALPSAAPGTIHVTLAGLASGSVVAEDAKTLMLAANAHAKVTFTLNAGTMLPDGGAPTCPDGQQDNDHNGTCSPDCANSGLSCDASMHQVCDDSTGTAACVCAVGYSMNMGACVLTPIPNDPGFQQMPMNAWTLENGAAIDPTAPGALDPGWLHFDKPAICGVHVPRAKQTITLPSYAAAGPLALKVSQYTDCTVGGMFGGVCSGPGQPSGGVSVVINGGVHPFTYLAAASTMAQTFCLGERAYGGTYELDVQPFDRNACQLNPVSYTQYVDHIDVEAAPNCPMPNSIPNGNFDGTGNWTMGTTPANSPPPIAEIKGGVGTNMSNAAHLFNGDRCQSAWIEGLMAVPLTAVPNVALQFTSTGTAATGAVLYVRVNGTDYGTVQGTGAKVTSKLCLVDAAKGMLVPIHLEIHSWPGDNGGCGMTTRDFVIDDLQFVSDPSCPATAPVPDGGFERTDSGMNYTVNFNTNAGTATGAGTITTSASLAHSGTHAFQGTVGGNFGQASITVPVMVPPSNGTSGPAITFWYKLPTAAASYSSQPGTTLTATATYAQKTVCIDPILSYHVIPFTVRGQANGGAVENFWVDDIAATTDPSCPAN